MIEYLVISNSKKDALERIKNKAAKSGIAQAAQQVQDEIQAQNTLYMILNILLLLLYTLAIYRAIAVCSGSSTDSKMLHLLFATTSPIIYLVFSFFTCGVPPFADAVAARTAGREGIQAYGKNLNEFLNGTEFASINVPPAARARVDDLRGRI